MLKAKIIPVTPFQQNCTLLWCDETMKGAVVDAGGEVDVILDAIKAQGPILQSGSVAGRRRSGYGRQCNT